VSGKRLEMTRGLVIEGLDYGAVKILLWFIGKKKKKKKCNEIQSRKLLDRKIV
jgi:hypothetical protein